MSMGVWPSESKQAAYSTSHVALRLLQLQCLIIVLDYILSYIAFVILPVLLVDPTYDSITGQKQAQGACEWSVA